MWPSSRDSVIVASAPNRRDSQWRSHRQRASECPPKGHMLHMRVCRRSGRVLERREIERQVGWERESWKHFHLFKFSNSLSWFYALIFSLIEKYLRLTNHFQPTKQMKIQKTNFWKHFHSDKHTLKYVYCKKQCKRGHFFRDASPVHPCSLFRYYFYEITSTKISLMDLVQRSWPWLKSMSINKGMCLKIILVQHGRRPNNHKQNHQNKQN